MFFLQPIGLVAMAGIVLPVIVHFWNDRRGKVLRIGSIHLLRSVSQRKTWRRLPSQWWLLLLRCLLVMALALLLAGPYWEGSGARVKGWVLVDAGAGRVYGARIDSLVKAGWERRPLEDTVNYWNAFRAADEMAPKGVEFSVFSLGLASRFAGVRPSTMRLINWDVYAPFDSVKEWEEKAWRVSRDSVRVIRGMARPRGTLFRGETVGAGDGEKSVAAGAGRRLDTGVINITVYKEAGYRQDGVYLEAGLRAVQEFTRRRIKVVMMGGGAASGEAAGGVPADGGEWLFRLSSRPVPAGMAERYANVWEYGTGKETTVDTWMEGAGVYRERMGELGGVDEPVWKDGFGRGVLTRKGKIFRYYSRLDPDWGALVWSRQFPVLLARMIYGEEGPGGHDLRMMDVGQVGPVRGDAGEAAGRSTEAGDGRTEAGDRRAGAIDLRPASWILIFLLFILERWWSGKE